MDITQLGHLDAGLSQPARRSAGGRRRWRKAWHERLEPPRGRSSSRGWAISDATPTGPGARRVRTTARSSARSSPSAAGATAIATWCCALVEHVPGRVRGLIGPWGHTAPEAGPSRTGDRFPAGVRALLRRPRLNEEENGFFDEPRLISYMQEPVAPAGGYAHRDGRWVADPGVAVAVDRVVDARAGRSPPLVDADDVDSAEVSARCAGCRPPGSRAASGAATAAPPTSAWTSGPTTAPRCAGTPTRCLSAWSCSARGGGAGAQRRSAAGARRRARVRRRARRKLDARRPRPAQSQPGARAWIAPSRCRSTIRSP